MISAPERASFSRVSKKTSALKLLTQIKSGKFSNTHSLLGKLSKRMSRYFPSLCVKTLSIIVQKAECLLSTLENEFYLCLINNGFHDKRNSN